MFKTVLILSNLIFSLILNVIFGEGVKVTQNAPDNVKPGDTFVVELVVNKTDVSGFAKIQQELPEGFFAEIIEAKGASFTFNDNKAKFIWMALPSEDSFTIKYKVTVGADVSGKKIVTGKFSYLYNNERKVVELPIQEITVGEEVDEPIADNLAPAPQGDDEEENDNSGDISATKKVTDLGFDQYKIDLVIKKAHIRGFAKLQQELPSNTGIVTANETKHAVFSNVDDQAKFVWMALPSDDVINVSYTITVPESSVEEVEGMKGSFAFLENEQTRKVNVSVAKEEEEQPKEEELVEEPIETVKDVIADETETTNDTADNITERIENTTTETEEGQEEAIVDEAVVEDDEIEAEESNTEEPEETGMIEVVTADNTNNSVTNVPAPEKGLVYKVQICAGHNTVKVVPYFKQAFKFAEGPISIESHEGWVKYTVGQFSQYKEARNRRNVVTAGYELPEPFVTAYNSGNRITVQEALMISNQKWVQ